MFALTAVTEHLSVTSQIQYFRAGGAADNPAAKLLG